MKSNLISVSLIFWSRCSTINAFQPIKSPSPRRFSVANTKTISSRDSYHAAKTCLDHKGLILKSKSLDIDDIEEKAAQAAEAWDIWCTPFFAAEETAQIQQTFQDRGDIACFPIGGFPPTADIDSSSAHRARFVFTNPDLGMDRLAAEKDYCTVLKIENIPSSDAYDPWANVLDSIGVNLENVGDVVIVKEDSEESVYLAVDPDVAKTCTRLLPKVLPGAGLSVSALETDENGDGETGIPEGEIQEMVIQRLDKREQKKK